MIFVELSKGDKFPIMTKELKETTLHVLKIGKSVVSFGFKGDKKIPILLSERKDRYDKET